MMSHRKRWASCVLFLALLAAVAVPAAAQRAAEYVPGAACSVTFTPDTVAGTFPGALQHDRQKGEYTVDLSGVPRQAEVFRAHLVLAGRGRFTTPPTRPTTVYPVGQPDKRLAFVPPLFQSLDALEAVRAAVQAGRPLRLRAEVTLRGVARLELSYVGGRPKAGKMPAVGDVKVIHRAGQSLITFAEPKLESFPEFATGADVRTFRAALLKEHKGLRFRIWRSTQEITPRTVSAAKLVGEIGPLSVWNSSYWQGATRSKPPVRYRVTDGADPLPWGTGVFAHNPAAAGQAYYAVTVAIDGEEDLSQLSAANTFGPVAETVGLGVPVLQWVERPNGWMYRRGKMQRRIYTRWESWPNASVPNRPIDYLVVLPQEPQPDKPGREPQYRAYKAKGPSPVGLHLHCWGGSLNGGYGWWYNGHKGAILIASNQVPYDWWTGYHEANNTNKTYGDGHVHPFTMNRVLSFLDWAKTQWSIDETRVFTAGSSMGGSGAPMYAIRHGERIAWCIAWVGVHVPTESPQFSGSYAGNYGPVKAANTMPDGRTKAWDFFSDVWWMRKHPARETGLIFASNGKNDGGIGWPQAVKFARALQQTRRPHIFNWGPGGHGTRTLFGANVPIDARTNQTLPAFSRCSLDDDVGTGTRKSKQQIEAEKQQQAAEVKAGKRRQVIVDPYDGDPGGQFNAYLRWGIDDIVDTPAAWEMTVYLIDRAPKDTCTVDLTPRRLQRFATPAGRRFAYTVTDVASGKRLTGATATADEHGLLTLPQIPVTQAKVRVKITPAR
jgi:hypothetical protein